MAASVCARSSFTTVRRAFRERGHDHRDWIHGVPPRQATAGRRGHSCFLLQPVSVFAKESGPRKYSINRVHSCQASVAFRVSSVTRGQPRRSAIHHSYGCRVQKVEKCRPVVLSFVELVSDRSAVHDLAAETKEVRLCLAI